MKLGMLRAPDIRTSACIINDKTNEMLDRVCVWRGVYD